VCAPRGDLRLALVGVGEGDDGYPPVDAVGAHGHARDDAHDGLADAVAGVEPLDVVGTGDALAADEVEAGGEVPAVVGEQPASPGKRDVAVPEAHGEADVRAFVARGRVQQRRELAGVAELGSGGLGGQLVGRPDDVVDAAGRDAALDGATDQGAHDRPALVAVEVGPGAPVAVSRRAELQVQPVEEPDAAALVVRDARDPELARVLEQLRQRSGLLAVQR